MKWIQDSFVMFQRSICGHYYKWSSKCFWIWWKHYDIFSFEIKCRKILISQSAEKEDDREKQQITNFPEASIIRRNTEVSSGASRILKNNKINKISTSPTAEDIRKITMYLPNKIKQCINKMKEDIALPETLTSSSKTLLTLMISFNRHKPEEIQRIHS